MGSSSSSVDQTRGPVDYGQLHQFVSNLLKNDDALSSHCQTLWASCGTDSVDFVSQEELQPVTQRLIDALSCRHSNTLQRIGAVYATVAERPGLSRLEFQGYVACVLTQILRELEARSTGSMAAWDVEQAETQAEAAEAAQPLGATLVEPLPEVPPEPVPEMSELQRLTAELTSLTASLEPKLQAEAPAPGQTAVEAVEPQVDEMAHLLSSLEDLNRSLGDGVKLEPSTGPDVATWQPPATQPAHRLEPIFPQMPQPVAHAPGAVVDPGNTYARALRSQVAEVPTGELGAWSDMDVGYKEELPEQLQAVNSGEMPPDEAFRPMANSWLNSRLNGAGKGLAHGWQAFADAMDNIFIPASRGEVQSEPHGEQPPVVKETPQRCDTGAGYEDVPAIFRQPTVEEVQEVLEQEGLPAYVAIASAGSFCAKKLCLDSSSSPYLYILEPNSSVPAVFFGMQGFCLEDLRRIVLSDGPLDSTSKPLLSLEFEDGFLPVRLGSALAKVLRGLVGVLCQGRNVQIMQQPAWS